MKPVMVVAIIVMTVLVLGIATLIAIGVRATRRQRAVLRHDRLSGVAFLCLPVNGQRRGAMATLSVDAREVRVVLQRARPTVITTLPAPGARVEPAQVRVNLAAVVDGVRITAADGREILLALYPDPTLGRTTPLKGTQLVERIAAISGALNRAERGVGPSE